ncbi:hypothetical protein ACRQ5B_15090 [Pseudarthrobacter sp. L19]|uniref:hypothetical protein n=1 Tax=Pseudarthrobacter sp. L19 TaxID=3423951 RepID=UPI003D790326
MSTTANDTTAIRSAAGLIAAARNGSTEEADRRSVNTDRSGYTPASLPDGVVYATAVEDVVDTMVRATADRIPVVARGRGPASPPAPPPRRGRSSWTSRG